MGLLDVLIEVEDKTIGIWVLAMQKVKLYIYPITIENEGGWIHKI